MPQSLWRPHHEQRPRPPNRRDPHPYRPHEPLLDPGQSRDHPRRLNFRRTEQPRPQPELGKNATGQRTGYAASLEETDEIAGATHLPLLVGSGVTAENVLPILSRTKGVIVASSLKEGGVWWNPVDTAWVSAFVEAATPGLAD